MNESLTIYLIGDGNLANSFAAHVQNLNIEFKWFKPTEQGRYFESGDELESATLYCLAVNDPNLSELQSKFSHKNTDSLYMFFSGSLSLNEIDDSLRVSSFILHPMQSFPSKDVVSLNDCYFTFNGTDEIYLRLSNQLNELQLNHIRIDMQNPVAYHLMGVFASNFMIALQNVCQRLAQVNKLDADQTKKLMIPIMQQTLDSIKNKDLLDALSGPLKRGDEQTIKYHEEFLKSFDVSTNELYHLLNEELKKVIKAD